MLKTHIKKIIPLLLSLFLFSCIGAKRESPMIYFSNASLKPIKNITCEWAKKHVLTLPDLNPGESRSQSFYIRGNSDFFGLVKISWTNSDDERISHEFFFRKKNLPSIMDRTTYNYVQLYFDQHFVEVTTSDAPDLSGKTAKMDQLLALYRDKYAEGDTEDNIHLINVQPKRDSSTPGWLLSSY